MSTVEISLTLNRFLHDFSAALWVACVVHIFLVRRAAARKLCEGAPPCRTIQFTFHWLSRLFWLCLLGTLFFGAIRAFFYRRFEWQTSLGEPQITFLIVKHILFFALVCIGIAYWLSTKRFIRNLCEGVSRVDL
jgi:putative copper export protein